MAKRALDHDPSLVDLTTMSLKDLAGLDGALIEGTVSRLLSQRGDANRLWADQPNARGHTCRSITANS
jgi:hypothetical protein